jgi:radical SAM protein with 4Fe4S-binding SPASM domain
MTSFAVDTPLPDFGLWDELERKGVPASFELEITARCNNDCRHCYINVPAGDPAAKANELTLDEICAIADQAVELGALWCLITGGEPLLRADFPDIYLALKRRGLLLSVFTNANLVRPSHVELFRAYPPRDLEISMYGASRETYERVTRVPGSFEAFRRGVELLERGGVPLRFKAMALRANVHELPAMAEFGRAHTKDVFRFDPLLHLRYDRDPRRNDEIRAERLSPEQITAIERTDVQREQALRRECLRAAAADAPDEPGLLFHCDIGQGFTVGHEGSFRLCAGLWHADYVGDVRKESLAAAWRRLMPAARQLRSRDAIYLGTCAVCPIIDLCLWCPAHADLETGSLDESVDYFCAAAHARAEVAGGLGEDALDEAVDNDV